MQGRAGGYVLIAEEWGLYLALLYTQACSPLKQCTRKTACILFGRMLKKNKRRDEKMASIKMDANMKYASFKAYDSTVKYISVSREAGNIDDLRANAYTDFCAAVRAFKWAFTPNAQDYDKILALLIRRVKGDMKLGGIAQFRKFMRELGSIVHANVDVKEYKAAPAPKAPRVKKADKIKAIYQKMADLEERTGRSEIDIESAANERRELMRQLNELIA